MSSLRRRISFAVVGITSLVVLVASVGIWMGTQALLLREVDQELAHWAERLRRFETLPPGSVRHRPPPASPPGEARTEHLENRRFFQVIAADSRREVSRSSSLPEGSTLVPVDGVLAEGVTTRRLADGRQVRVMAIRLTHAPAFAEAPASSPGDPAPESGGVVALMGIDFTSTNDEARAHALMLALLWTSATLLAWGSVALLRATILRPVQELTVAIGQLGPEDLAARVPDAAGPDEVRGIVARLNGLLDRLEAAFKREQATISNIAHELRTPVTTLRTAIEFRLLAATAPEETTVLRDCLATVERMQAQVTNLLLLARLEAGKEPLRRDEVDVAALVSETVELWEGRAAARGQRLRIELPETAPTRTSPGHLRQILDNLVGNAVTHAPAHAEIRVAVTAAAGAVTVVVENPFAGELDARELGKPFYRGDAARRDSGHNGLGLVLCHRLVRLLGGNLDLTAQGGTFRAGLELPGQTAAAPAAAGSGKGLTGG
jgi:signal transduction histidine kinase